MEKQMDNHAEKNLMFIKLGYCFLNHIVSFFILVCVWIPVYCPWWSHYNKLYINIATLFTLYNLVYYVFAKLYSAYRFKNYKVSDMVFCQFLAYGFTNVVTYLEGCIYFRKVIDIFPFILIYIFQLLLSTLFALFFHKIYSFYQIETKIAIIHGDCDPHTYVERLNKIYKQRVVQVISENEEIETICKSVESCNVIYLIDVSEKVRRLLLLIYQNSSKKIYLSRDIEELMIMGYDVSHDFDTPFICSPEENAVWYYPVLKRFFDVIFSVIGIIVLSPVIIIISICIKVNDGGPIFYRQKRLTIRHREFMICKFRSMKVNAEADGIARLSCVNDNRITAIGGFIRKTRLDELPQLFNILKGDMSFVGPRPERPEIEQKYMKECPEFSMRLKVKAGLTGYAQIYGKYNTTFYDKLRFDLIYINKRSLILDLKIIFLTFKILFLKESTEGITKEQMTDNKDVVK